MQGKKRRKGRQKQKKSAVLAPQAARQPAYTPEWCTHTHTLLLRPISPLHFAAKKAKGKVFHTHTHTSNWHLISQPKGWLAQRWLRLCLCPTQRTTLTLRSPSLLLFYPSLLLTPPLATILYLLPSSISISPLLPASPFLSFLSLSSTLCTAPLCTAPVLPHSQGGITRQNAGTGEEKKEKRGRGRE